MLPTSMSKFASNCKNLFKIVGITENFWQNPDEIYYIAASTLQTSDEYLNRYRFRGRTL